MSAKENAELIATCERFVESLSKALEAAALVRMERDKFNGSNFDYFFRREIDDAAEKAKEAAICMANAIQAIAWGSQP